MTRPQQSWCWWSHSKHEEDGLPDRKTDDGFLLSGQLTDAEAGAVTRKTKAEEFEERLKYQRR